MAMPVPHYTLADLDAFPDDGQRYEILQGHLLVTPQPRVPHQVAAARLVAELSGYLGAAAFVVGPGEIERAPDIHLEPDLLVFPPPLPESGKWSDLTGH